MTLSLSLNIEVKKLEFELDTLVLPSELLRIKWFLQSNVKIVFFRHNSEFWVIKNMLNVGNTELVL